MGRFESIQVDIAAKYGGRIKEILANEGDLVDQGQVLVRMDTGEQEAELANNKANVAANQDLNESFSTGAAISIGAARDGTAATSRVTRERLAFATLVGRGRDCPPTFLRYQQRSFVAWLMR